MNPPAFAVDAALALRRRLLRAADAVLPPWAALFDRTMGIVRTHALAALAELGVPAALGDRALGLDELAVRVGADADTLRRLMRIAELDGIVKRDRRGRYALTRVGAILRPDAEGSLDPWVRYLTLGSTRAAYAELAGSVRTGEPSFRRAHGKTVWDHYSAHPEEEALFASAMRSISAFAAPELAAASLWPDTGTVCDVAGGTGELLAAIVGPRPGLRGIVVDLKGVVDSAPARERVEFVVGDLFAPIEVAADLYVLKNILHDWDEATCVSILRNVPGRVVVIEQVQDPERPHPFATPTDIQMLTQTDGGRERSVAELQALLRQAGKAPGPVELAGTSALVQAG